MQYTALVLLALALLAMVTGTRADVDSYNKRVGKKYVYPSICVFVYVYICMSLLHAATLSYAY